MEKERMMRIENRCDAAEKELEGLRKDHKDLSSGHIKMNQENGD